LENFNLLVHPVWIFDFIDKRMRWANDAALELWNATSLQELQQRNFHDISESSTKRMEEWMLKVLEGQQFDESWTMYPKGIAKTVHLNVSGIRISHHKDVDDHFSFFLEGVPLPNNDLLNEERRGVEMLRHLPMAVCQFDMDGNVMFQNPHACMVKIVGNDKEGHREDAQHQHQHRQQQQQQQQQHQDVDAEDESSSSSSFHEEENDDHDDHDCTSSSSAAWNDDGHANSCSCATVNDASTVSTTSYSNSERTTTPMNAPNNPEAINPPSKRLRNKRNNKHHPSSSSAADLTGGVQKRKRHCGNLLQRFVDPKIGQEALRELQTNAIHNKDTSADDMNKQIDLEAMVHTHEGPKWSAVQLRACKDPVTGDNAILFSSIDKSDAIRAQQEKEARERKSEFLAIMA
jgi:hypothetical protein